MRSYFVFLLRKGIITWKCDLWYNCDWPFVYLPFFSYMAKPQGQTDFRHSAVNEVASMQKLFIFILKKNHPK